MNIDIEFKLKGSNILIVDDVELNLLMLSEILKRAGYNVLSAIDGYSALKVCEEKKPDLILLDIMMPEMDGYEVCRHLKADKRLCDIPVIFISALDDSQAIVKAFVSGGVDYVTKPFQSKEVTARVETHLKLYHQSKKLQELNANLENSQNELKKFASQLQTIRDEERYLLGTEIHDKISQILVALKIDMGIWRRKVLFKLQNNISSEIMDNFNELVNLVDNTISTARKITSNLKSDALGVIGFIEISKLYCAEFESIYKINCCLETTISELELDEKQKTGLYKILQEALLIISNRLNTSFVKVSIFIENNMLVISVEDDGKMKVKSKGVDTDDFGALVMNERIQLLNGNLIVECNDNGTNLTRVEMPYSVS